MEKVINSINNHQAKNFHSMSQTLLAFFTQPQVVLPQANTSFYKYKINEKVLLNAFKNQRTHLGFKYSLNRGNFSKKQKHKNNYIYIYIL